MQFAAGTRTGNIEDAFSFFCFAHAALFLYPLIQGMPFAAFAADGRNEDLVLCGIVDANPLQHADQLLAVASCTSVESRYKDNIKAETLSFVDCHQLHPEAFTGARIRLCKQAA